MDAAEASTAAAAGEHARALASLVAMHDARLDAVRQQTDAQLAALLDAFASCVLYPVLWTEANHFHVCCDLETSEFTRVMGTVALNGDLPVGGICTQQSVCHHRRVVVP